MNNFEFENDNQIINLSEFYSTGNMPKIFMYEILNKKNFDSLNIKEASINIFKIGNEKIIYGTFDERYLQMSITPPSEDQIVKQADIKYRTNFRFLTNQDIPKNDEIHNYVFTFEPFSKNKKQKIYIIGNNNSFLSSDLVSQNQNSKMWTLELIEISSLDIFKNTKSIFVLDKPPFNDPNRGNLESILFRFNSTALINNIEFTGDIYQQKHEILNTTINFSTDYKYIVTLFAIPVWQNDNQIMLYTSWLNKNYSMLLGDINPGFNLGNLTIATNEYLDQQALDTFYDIIDVTNKLTSGFSGMNDDQIRHFKETKFSGSDPKDYVDFKISQFLNNKEKDYKRKFKNYILALSEYIASSYCWGGGLTQQHKLGLPFYMDYINDKLYYRSAYYNLVNENGELKLENTFHGFSFHNVYTIDSKVVSLPNLPSKIEEQDLSNSPVDFNKTSFNFNYITYAFLPDETFKNLVFGNYDIQTTEPQSIKYTFEKNIDSVSSDSRANLAPNISTSKYDGRTVQKTYYSGSLIDTQNFEIQSISKDNLRFQWSDTVKNKIKKITEDNIDVWARSANASIPRDAEFERYEISEYITNFENYYLGVDGSGSLQQVFNTWNTKFKVRVNVWYKSKKTTVNKLGDPSYIFSYSDWVNFFKKYNYWGAVFPTFIPQLENNYSVKKINSIIISGFFIKDFDVIFKYENDKQTFDIWNFEAFDTLNENFTKTIINF